MGTNRFGPSDHVLHSPIFVFFPVYEFNVVYYPKTVLFVQQDMQVSSKFRGEPLVLPNYWTCRKSEKKRNLNY